MSGDDWRNVADGLNRSIALLVRELLPHGRRDGGYWRVGSLLDEPGGSLSVVLSGALQGRWKDFATAERGDALDLVAQVRHHGDKRAALEWAREWLRLPARRRGLSLRSSAAARRQTAVVLPYEGAAKRLWREARLLRRDDPVWNYLRDRNIDLGRLPALPGALGYQPRLWNTESQRHWPAMLAAITDNDERLVAVHRTWLWADPITVAKAPLTTPKKVLGGYRGGSIKLWPGAQRTGWRAIQPGETVLVGEGIEDTLSAVSLWPQPRAICAVSLSGMLSLDLPAAIGTVLVLAQNDAAGSKAAEVLRAVIERWTAAGRRVRVIRPPAIVKDWNDLARWGAKHRVGFGIAEGGGDDGQRSRKEDDK